MTATGTKLKTLSIAQVESSSDFNPREKIDDKSVAELTDSIKQLGVLEPIIVTASRTNKDRFKLVAGHRRLRAAKRAGLESIPAVVRQDNHSLAAAITENVMREELSPIEEARAIERLRNELGKGPKETAQLLGKSVGFVNQRLRLLKLPEKVQGALHSGKVPMAHAAFLQTIAGVSQELADAVADYMTSPSFDPGLMEAEGQAFVVEETLGSWKPKTPPPALAITYHVTVPDLIPGKEHAELLKRYNAVKSQQGGPWAFKLTDRQIDAARAYGCLLEFKEDHYGIGASRFICDWEWLATAAEDEIKKLEKKAAKAGKETAAPEPAADAGDGKQTAAQKKAAKIAAEAKEKRRAELEAEKKDRVEARGANLELGRRLAKDLQAPKLTMAGAKVLAQLVLGGNDEAIPFRGLRYVVEDWQEVEVTELKRGGTKETVTYAEGFEAAEKMYAWLNKAKTPQQLLGRVLQLVCAAEFADEAVVAMSKRSRFSFRTPGMGWDRYDSGSDCELGQFDELVEEVAKPSLPPRMVKQAAEAKKKGKRL